MVDRDKDIADLRKNAGDNEALNKKLTDLQAKYDSDTASLNKKLDEQARDHATEKLFADYKFTSAYAKKAAIAEFRSGNPEFKDGKFTGAADIIKKMQDEEKKLASTQRI